MVRALSMAAAVIFAGSALLAGPAWSGQQKTVVELFTSQGCSSCPPADAFLGELTENENVIALTLPVDYWDYLGWKDTLASPAYTKRQHDYARNRGDRRVYTPQMVFNGRQHAVGSRRKAVFKAIEVEQRRDESEWIPVSLKSGKDSIMVSAGAYKGKGEAPAATLWLLLTTKKETVSIHRGENHGREIAYYNVVRQMVPIGSWHGTAMEKELPKSDLMEGYDGCTAILQVNGVGEILGAAQYQEQ